MLAQSLEISSVFTVEESSAIRSIEIVPSDNSDVYDALITYQSSDKVYRYNIEDDATAQKWFSLLSNAEDRGNTSWGREVSRAIKHGDLDLI